MQPSDLPVYHETDRWQLFRDSDRVWINDRSGLIGRYSPRGIDVHADGTCLDCKTSTNADDAFDRFVELMQQHHNINLKAL